MIRCHHCRRRRHHHTSSPSQPPPLTRPRHHHHRHHRAPFAISRHPLLPPPSPPRPASSPPARPPACRHHVRAWTSGSVGLAAAAWCSWITLTLWAKQWLPPPPLQPRRVSIPPSGDTGSSTDPCTLLLPSRDRMLNHFILFVNGLWIPRLAARAHVRGARIRSKLTCSDVHAQTRVVADPQYRTLNGATSLSIDCPTGWRALHCQCYSPWGMCAGDSWGFTPNSAVPGRCTSTRSSSSGRMKLSAICVNNA